MESFATTLRDEKSAASAIERAKGKLLAILPQATAEERNTVIQRLSPLILLPDDARASPAAVFCGLMVEQGADPHRMEDPLLARLLPAIEELSDLPAEPAEAEAGLPQRPATRPKKPGFIRMLWRLLFASYRYRRAMKEAAARMTPTEKLVDSLLAPIIAMFSASPALRAAHPEVRELAAKLRDRVAGCECLHSLFNVLDDEPLLVIEPATGIGIRARLSGTDVNFTLATPLMHRFPNAQGEACSRLSAKATSVFEGGPQSSGEWVAGIWNLHTWRAIDDNLALSADQAASRHWIWNEGQPADIPVFEGRRVVLLGPASYQRTWPAQRTFAALLPELRIESQLAPEEVRECLTRMRDARDTAIDQPPAG